MCKAWRKGVAVLPWTGPLTQNHQEDFRGNPTPVPTLHECKTELSEQTTSKQLAAAVAYSLLKIRAQGQNADVEVEVDDSVGDFGALKIAHAIEELAHPQRAANAAREQMQPEASNSAKSSAGAVSARHQALHRPLSLTTSHTAITMSVSTKNTNTLKRARKIATPMVLRSPALDRTQ